MSCSPKASRREKFAMVHSSLAASRRRGRVVSHAGALIACIVTHFFLLLIIVDPYAQHVGAQAPTIKSQNGTRLECKAGERRHFNYESTTKVWGTSKQEVRVRAQLRLSCMEAPTNQTLKYLGEIISVEASFGVDGDFGPAGGVVNGGSKLSVSKSKQQRQLKKAHQFLLAPEAALRRGGAKIQDKLVVGPQEAQAEPVLEEVAEAIGETANRVKRSVSGWFSKTWGSVKDFFVNIFNSSEKSSVSRDEAFKESGLDIAGQCKAKSGKPNGGLPIDDSVFDDLEPKYYIGASSADSLAGTTNYYDFDYDDQQQGNSIGVDSRKSTTESNGNNKNKNNNKNNNNNNDLEDDYSTLSFFDDPAPKRLRRAIDLSTKPKSNSNELTSADEQAHERQLKLPFLFLQSRQGKIIEIRFSSDETDLASKNFKRHLCDLFATNLDESKALVNEVTPIGKHKTNYLIDTSSNSSAIRQSLTAEDNKQTANNRSHVATTAEAALANDEKAASGSRLLIKAMAMVGMDTKAGGELPSLASMEAASGGGNGDAMARRPWHGAADADGSQESVSVLRSINTTNTIQVSSRTISPEIESMQVEVKQVQRISEGRMTGSAGQLGMSLIQAGRPLSSSSARSQRGKQRRTQRSTQATGDDSPADMADLLQVSSSFALQLVPLGKFGKFAGEKGEMEVKNGPLEGHGNTNEMNNQRSVRSTSGAAPTANDDSPEPEAKSMELVVAAASATGQQSSSKEKDKDKSNEARRSPGLRVGEQKAIQADNNTQSSNRSTEASGSKREPLVTRPSDELELQRTVQEWRHLEARLQFGAQSLLAELGGPESGQVQRLEVLRDQIHKRLNEEFMRNQRRAWNKGGPPVAAATVFASSPPGGAARPAASKSDNYLGLGLTQLVLDTGFTARHKGSVYSTLEEALELEAALGDETGEGSMARLLRETVRMDKLRDHCKSSIATLKDIRAQSARLELKGPFGVDEVDDDQGNGQSAGANERLARVVSKVAGKNLRRLEQCKQVLQLLLRASERQAADLVLDLVDECNERMLAGSKDEELGHGPTSRYYRNLRQQFTELLASMNKPSEQVLDKLIQRLQFSKTTDTGTSRRKTAGDSEFTYVAPKDSSSQSGSTKYNKSLLREEDDYNNNDGAGSLVTTITLLASRPSVKRAKRGDVAGKLLGQLKSSTCSTFHGPDLDILESMANFQEPMDEIVLRVVQLARRCRSHDQYLIACVHALQGQLQHSAAQRLLAELLRSQHLSCTVKSEILLTLMNAIVIDDLKLLIEPHMAGDLPDEPTAGRVANSNWPSVGVNQVDEILLELVDDNRASRAHDKRCLGPLAAAYMAKKRTLTPTTGNKHRGQVAEASGRRIGRNGGGGGTRARTRRAVVNDNSFWDEANCKRWASPAPNGTQHSWPGESELDDVGFSMMANNNTGPRHTGLSQKMLEREADMSLSGHVNGSTTFGGSATPVRRRHKCTASKTYGPRNAEATLRAEVVNDLVGPRDENKFLARFRLGTNFLGNRIDIGRMYLWHQKGTTRAHVNILGKSLWDTSHSCLDKAPHHLLYMPLFDFNLWLVKVSVGLRLQSEMGFFSNCDSRERKALAQGSTNSLPMNSLLAGDEVEPAGSGKDGAPKDHLELYPTIRLRASGEASAKFVVARAGMSLASQYGYQGNIRVSRQPDSCMSIYSAHQPMNVTFSSWFQLWDNDCHYWGSRGRAEPQAIKWKLPAQRPTVWLEDECLYVAGDVSSKVPSSSSSSSGTSNSTVSAKSQMPATISP